MGLRGEGLHVVHGTGTVVHMREHQHRHIGLQGGGDFVGFDQLEGVAALFAQGLGDVEVGRKVAALADDFGFVRVVGFGDVQRCGQHFEQVDRGAVGGHHLTRLGADDACDLVAHALGQGEPACGVPAFDQVGTPFVRHGMGHAGRGGFGQHAQ